MRRKLIAMCAIAVVLAVGSAVQADPTSTHTFEVDSYSNQGGEYPHVFEYVLTVTEEAWSEVDSLPVDDFEIFWPYKVGGYIEVIPPENWAVNPIGLYGFGYEANTGAEFTNAGSLSGFTIKGKFPELIWGESTVTKDGVVVGGVWKPTQLPNTPEPATICLLGLGGVSLIRRRRRRAV